MSRDPLARSDIWPEVPNDTEYDAVYAAVTATERGRWFLTEYSSRNRHADTLLLLAAMARVEVAIRGQGPAAPGRAFARDLTAMAAAIDQSKNLTVADRTDAPDVGAAAERILDIAFGLRESAADAALCDALDAAARELCAASANSIAAAERARGVTELLRDLAGRGDAMVKSSLASQTGSEVDGPVDSAAASQTATQVESNVLPEAAEPPIRRVTPDVSGEIKGDPAFAAIAAGSAAMNQNEGRTEGATEADLLLRSGLLDENSHDGEEFNEVLAVAPTSQSAGFEETEAASIVDIELGNLTIPPMEYVAALEPRALEPAEQTRRWFIESPDFAFSRTDRDSGNGTVGSSGAQGQRLVSDAGPGPQDDPADLFESSMSASAPPSAAADMPDLLASAPSAPTEVPPPQSSADALPASSDPFAGMRALSEQETIALFG
jgi:hypothetical protein